MKVYLSSLIFFFMVASAFSIPKDLFNIVSTYDDSVRGYLEVPDRNGEKLPQGSIWHLIVDQESDGLSPPSLEDENYGYPQDDDSLVFQGISGNNLYVIDSLATIVSLYRLDHNLVSLPFFLRIFDSDTLFEDIYYTESYLFEKTTEISILPAMMFHIPPFDGGGVMEYRLNSEDQPALYAERDLNHNNLVDSLSLDDGFLLTLEGSAGHGVKHIRILKYENQLPDWNLSVKALPSYYVISQDFENNSAESYTQKVSIPISDEEVSEFYNGEFESSNMLIYRRTSEGWMELSTSITALQTKKADAYKLDSPMYGYFALAPEGLYPVDDIQDKSIVHDFHLYPVYPNPFNPATTIHFQIPVNSQVKLAVYNIIGEEVCQIVNQVLPQGHHEYIYKAEQNASGVYFLKFETNGYHSIRKMILLK